MPNPNTSARHLVSASRMFDASGRVLPDSGVLVTGNQISATGPREQLSQQFGGTDLIEEHYDGCTLLPGLIDAHVHLMMPGAGDAFIEHCQNPDEVLTLTAARNAWLCLQAGFTTVADFGAKGTVAFRLRDAMRKKIVMGSRLILCGRPLTSTGGHAWPLQGEADGVDGLRRAVRQLCKEGADFIKVIVTGGGTPGTDSRRPSYSEEELRTIVEEAHGKGRQVFGHSGAIAGTGRALDAGFDLIAHCHFQTPDGRNDFDEPLARRIVEQGVFVNPTLQTNRVRGDEQVINRLPLEARQSTFAAWRARYDKIAENFANLNRVGVRLVCGSDSGWGWSAFGDNYLELDAMVAAGMSPCQALLSATRTAAHALGWEDRIGSLENGKMADLLVVAGDPTQNIRALKDVRGVWLEGKRAGSQPFSD